MDLFRKKTELLSHEENGSTGSLKRTMNAFDLTMLGVGCIIGTGIFVITGKAAAENAGPGLMLSFVIAGIACVLAALCYAELSSTVPAAGSAYAYSYFVFGEVLAWVLGWDLILEYGVAAASVSSGWSAYFQGLLAGFDIHLPLALTAAYDSAKGTIIDLPAVCIIMLITLLLGLGARETVRFNFLMVCVKVGIVLLFIAIGIFYVKPVNWTPFLPFGFSGVFSAAAIVFFAYLGFDAISTAAEEVRNPQRTMPIGIISSLAICTVLYIAVSIVLTGMVPYTQLGVSDPVAFALRYIHQDFVAGLISVGAIAGMTTVLLVLLYGQTRLIFSISRDGLLPVFLSTVNSKTQTPIRSTWLVGSIIALASGLFPLHALTNLTSIGTLFAFAVVSVGVIVLRKKRPDLKRGFVVPWVPVIPILSALVCIGLMLQLHISTWIGFILWLLLGLLIYFFYGYHQSLLNRKS